MSELFGIDRTVAVYRMHRADLFQVAEAIEEEGGCPDQLAYLRYRIECLDVIIEFHEEVQERRRRR